ncbi:hypothetical protein G8759_15520 [Spirosoma aureum]|uniref:Uncharacterized protein n=1 Tax=Spirosoma aureum TaxID=2692134 RepID=A0A6G9ANJ8_9BACT|nr:hypothetical protein [Spirosoma aureum]QIP13919.1 hypothetical protein G8759_15520 [Spirosoma aureum]
MRSLLLAFWLFLTISMVVQQGRVVAQSTITITSFGDSLVAKRGLLTTAIYKNNERQSNAAVRSLYQSNPKALAQHRWGNLLKPIGPIMIISGLAIGYLGIRGEQQKAFIRGIGTKTQPNVPDVEVEYTKRSLPKTLLGLGLFIGAFYMIERSNELTSASVNLYNAKPSPIRDLSRLEKLKLGITSTGNVGLEAQF